MDNKFLYTSGEFAKLMGINKRTLHFYNDIGLFSPILVAENGYHYYSIYQFAQLEMILTLRRIGVSIDDIQKYFNSNSRNDSLFDIMTQQKTIIDNTINNLLNIKQYLKIKAKRIEIGMKAENGKIEIVNLPKRHILLSPPITNNSDEEDLSIIADFSLELKKQFNLYDTVGSRIEIQNIIEGNYDNYANYFAYCPAEDAKVDLVLPDGKYLVAFNIGSWDTLPHLYRKILKYAKENNLILSKYSYEEGLNDLAIKNIDDYITLITIKIDESSKEKSNTLENE